MLWFCCSVEKPAKRKRLPPQELIWGLLFFGIIDLLAYWQWTNPCRAYSDTELTSETPRIHGASITIIINHSNFITRTTNLSFLAATAFSIHAHIPDRSSPTPPPPSTHQTKHHVAHTDEINWRLVRWQYLLAKAWEYYRRNAVPLSSWP